MIRGREEEMDDGGGKEGKKGQADMQYKVNKWWIGKKE